MNFIYTFSANSTHIEHYHKGHKYTLSLNITVKERNEEFLDKRHIYLEANSLCEESIKYRLS